MELEQKTVLCWQGWVSHTHLRVGLGCLFAGLGLRLLRCCLLLLLLLRRCLLLLLLRRCRRLLLLMLLLGLRLLLLQLLLPSLLLQEVVLQLLQLLCRHAIGLHVLRAQTSKIVRKTPMHSGQKSNDSLSATTRLARQLQ